MKSEIGKILRVGVIGCGNIFRSHSPVYVDNQYAVLVGFYDRIQNRAEAWYAQFKLEMELLHQAVKDLEDKEDQIHLQRYKIFNDESKVYNEVADLIENVDIIDICSPTYSHAPYAKWGLLKNKYVMIEKPPTRCSLETQELCEIARNSTGKLQINEHFLWQRYIHEFNSILEEGKLGNLQKIHIRLGHGGPSWGWQNHFLNPSLSGGGILADMGSHAIGALIGILGNKFNILKIQSLQMLSGTERERTIQKTDGINEYYVQKVMVEDEATLKLWLDTPYSSDPLIVILEVSWSKTYKDIILEGTSGKCRLGFDKLKRKVLVLEQNGDILETVQLSPQGRDSHQLQVIDFLETIGTGNNPWANHDLSHKIQTIISGAYLSNLKGYETLDSDKGIEITPNDINIFYNKMINKGVDKSILVEEIVYRLMSPFTSTYYAPGSKYTQHLNLHFD